MGMLSIVLSRDDQTKSAEPHVVLKNYKGFDVVQRGEGDYHLYDRKNNSLEKKIYLGLDSAKKAADVKFDKWRTQMAASYPLLALVLAELG